MADVLVVGEALVDVLLTGDEQTRRPGGSPANVAVGLARLEVGTSLLTCFADDADGRLLSEHLSTAGVAVSRPPGTSSTSTALARVGPDGQATYEFSLSWDLAGVAQVPLPAVLHVGSFAATERPGCEQVLDLAQRATGLVTYDLNCRPAIMGSPAQVLPTIERLVALADLVKLSDEDAQWLYGSRYDDTDVLDHLHDLGAALVVLTTGADGCVASTGTERFAVPAAPGGVVVDTVGAGDAFMAGLISRLVGRTDLPDAAHLREALDFASVVARRTCERVGADPPTLAEL